MTRLFRGASFYILIFIIIVAIVQMYGANTKEINELEYSQLIIMLEQQRVKSLILEENLVMGVLDDGTEFQSTVPDVQTFNQFIMPQIQAGILQVKNTPPRATPGGLSYSPHFS